MNSSIENSIDLDIDLLTIAQTLSRYTDSNYHHEERVSPVQADNMNDSYKKLVGKNHSNYTKYHIKLCIWTINDNMARIYDILYGRNINGKPGRITSKNSIYSEMIVSLFEETESIKAILGRLASQKSPVVKDFLPILKDSKYLEPYDKELEEERVMQAYSVHPEVQIDLNSFRKNVNSAKALT